MSTRISTPPAKRPLFPTTVVGSMPRSQFVRDLFDPAIVERLGPERVAEQMDQAVAYVIAMQEAAGIDVISDGEWRRLSYIGVIADIVHGFERGTRDGLSWHVVTDRMTPKRPGLIAEEANFLIRHTRAFAKVALPSPYLLGQRMWEADKSSKAYPTREAFMQALVPILREELRQLADVGIEIAQFDDPHLCLFVDPRVRAQFENPQREMDLCVDLINQIIDGVPGIRTAIHLCRRNKARAGWVGEGGYDPILPALKRLHVQQYMMEFTIPAAGDLSVLREIPDDRTVGLGCVDCRGEHIDTPEEIVARVERVLQFLRPDQIWLNPDCGFAPGSAADIPIDEAYAKLKNESVAAQMLRAKYS
jgi:5-methyltetrahydropteroyltriglutamate--homocysteine methyltransferase